MPTLTLRSFDSRDVQTDNVPPEFYAHNSDGVDEYNEAVATASQFKGADVSEFKQQGWWRTTIVFADRTSSIIELIW